MGRLRDGRGCRYMQFVQCATIPDGQEVDFQHDGVCLIQDQIRPAQSRCACRRMCARENLFLGRRRFRQGEELIALCLLEYPNSGRWRDRRTELVLQRTWMSMTEPKDDGRSLG